MGAERLHLEKLSGDDLRREAVRLEERRRLLLALARERDRMEAEKERLAEKKTRADERLAEGGGK